MNNAVVIVRNWKADNSLFKILKIFINGTCVYDFNN